LYELRRGIRMINILLSQYNFNHEWAKETVQKYITPNDKIAVIPFAFSEKWISNSEEWDKAYDRSCGKYYKEIVEPFIELGINEDNIIWLNYFEDADDEMKKAIESSKIIFLTGGFPERAVERLIEKELLNYINNNNKLVIGASAGALMQLNNYFTSPDEDYTEFMYYHGLGLINKDFYIEVHYENTDVQNDCIKRVLKERTDTVYAIKDNGGIIVDNGNFILLGDVVTFKSN
jgi:peptidase E